MTQIVFMVGAPGGPRRIVTGRLSHPEFCMAAPRGGRVGPNDPATFAKHVYRLYPLWRRGELSSWLAVFSRSEAA